MDILSFSIEQLTSPNANIYSPYDYGETPVKNALYEDALADSSGPNSRTSSPIEGVSPCLKWLTSSPDSGIASPPQTENVSPTSTSSSDTSSVIEGSLNKVVDSSEASSSSCTPSPASNQKPSCSYIELISRAILSSPEQKLVLSDIYQYIMDNYPYYNNHERAWRNSIRHNLSLNECFVKSGRAENGKGHYWAIHAACAEDFSKGDFRRRQARRRARTNGSHAGHTTNVSALPMAYRCNMGYVPMTSMTSSTRSYHPYASPYFTPPSSLAMSGNGQCAAARLPSYSTAHGQLNIPPILPQYATTLQPTTNGNDAYPLQQLTSGDYLPNASLLGGTSSLSSSSFSPIQSVVSPSPASSMSSLTTSNYFQNILSQPVSYSPYGLSSLI